MDKKYVLNVSKFNRELNNQVTLLMITDGTAKWHYISVKECKDLG